MLRHVARLGWGKIVFPAPDLSSVVHADVGRFWCLVGQDRLKMHDAAPTDVGPGVVVGVECSGGASPWGGGVRWGGGGRGREGCLLGLGASQWCGGAWGCRCR